MSSRTVTLSLSSRPVIRHSPKREKEEDKAEQKSQFTESAHLFSSSLWFFAFLSTRPMYSQIATCHWGFVPATAHTSSFVRINF